MRRECLFAWTAPTGDGYPEYLNITREEDGSLTISVRSPKRPPFNPNEAEFDGQNKHPFPMPGHVGSMKLPPDQLGALLHGLRGFTINVNGQDWQFFQPSISYERIVEMAGLQGTPAVKVRYRSNRESRLLLAGEYADVEDNAVISACHTGLA